MTSEQIKKLTELYLSTPPAYWPIWLKRRVRRLAYRYGYSQDLIADAVECEYGF